MKDEVALVQSNPWEQLRAHTPARIALGRVGASMPTAEVLRFGLAHARARDAVHHPLDSAALQARLVTAGFDVRPIVHSQASDRQTYLLRPDLGRRLDDAFRPSLQTGRAHHELVIVIADGLSSIAVERHAVPLLEAFRALYDDDWQHVPVVVAEQARVAIGDDIGQALSASMVIVLIGERPGLTSPDSLGIYFTYQPRTGRMDSERNCISNVRPEGLCYAAAASRLNHMVRAALRLGLTGVALKDDSDETPLEGPSASTDLLAGS